MGHISQNQIDKFQDEGVLVLKGAFGDWVEKLRKGVDDNLADLGVFACDNSTKGDAGHFVDDYCNWERIPEYEDFIRNSTCAEIAGLAMQSDSARIFHEHIVVKEAQTAKATPWHHDLPYYCVDGTQTVSVWIALDYVPLESAVEFVAGSHKSGELYHPRLFVDGANYTAPSSDLVEVPDIDSNRQAYTIRSWAVEPGDAVLFDYRTLHGTSAVKLQDRRRAIAFRWLGDDVTYCDRDRKTSPPYPELAEKLSHGDALLESVFPTIWEE